MAVRYVCDVCQDPLRSANRWSIIEDGSSGTTVELCEEHSEPLGALILLGAPLVRKTRKRIPSSPRQAPRETTMEEIEAEKAARRNPSSS